MKLTIDYLRSVLSYNPDTGEWLWVRCPPPNQRYTGTPAGNRRHDGYLMIRIRGRLYYGARLAVFYMTGKWPKEEVDHKDRDASNDRWSNIREATSSQNKFNRVSLTDIRGVYQCGKSSWQVMVGRNNYLGTFGSLEEAINARDAEAIRLGGEFAILNSDTGTLT